MKDYHKFAKLRKKSQQQKNQQINEIEEIAARHFPAYADFEEITQLKSLSEPKFLKKLSNDQKLLAINTIRDRLKVHMLSYALDQKKKFIEKAEIINIIKQMVIGVVNEQEADKIVSYVRGLI